MHLKEQGSGISYLVIIIYIIIKKKMKRQNRQKFITAFLKEAASLDICNYYGYADEIRDLFFENWELTKKYKNAKSWQLFVFEIEETINAFIYEQEVIGYKNACDFLAEFDPSFRVGLEEAKNEDWTFSALSSEVLAGLALRSILKNEMYDTLRDLRKEEVSK